ncbi:MAG: cation transporter, partial [Patescibacteria group bacterium]
MEKKTYNINGMSCASCAVKIEKALLKTPGVKKAVVNFFMQQATITGNFKDEDVKKAVESAGYEIYLPEKNITSEVMLNRSKDLNHSEHKMHRMPSGEMMEGASHGEHAEHAKMESAAEIRTLRNKFLFGTVISAIVLILTYAMYFPILKNINAQILNYLMLILSTPVQIWLGWQFYRGTWRGIKHFSANMDTLIAVGTTAAYLYSTA